MTIAEIMAWVMAIFFAAVGVFHMSGVGKTREQFRIWGFPPGFYFVNGLLQLAAGVLMALPSLRLYGFALAGALMLAAAATVIAKKAYSHSIGAFVILALIVTAWRIQ